MQKENQINRIIGEGCISLIGSLLVYTERNKDERDTLSCFIEGFGKDMSENSSTYYDFCVFIKNLIEKHSKQNNVYQ